MTTRRTRGTVQAWIAAVSFPTEPRDVLDMVLDDSAEVDTTNLQALILSAGNEDCGGWTVPRWGMQGDITFFYQAKKAMPRITSLIGQFREMALGVRGNDRDTLERVVDLLLKERELALRLEGSVFACAHLSDRALANYSQEEKSRYKHWRSPVYGSIANVHLFEEPLHYDIFGRYLTLSTGTITPLEAPAFKKLRQLLSEDNRARWP